MIPGGHLTRSKAIFQMRGYGGRGAYVYTADREYLDLLCALGARTISNDPPAQDGGVYSLSQHEELEAAADVIRDVAPWATSVRFVKTGSESLTAACRIAKKATGRSKIAIGDWAYHGWHDWIAHAERFRYLSDLSALETDPNELAAVFIEPHRWASIDVDWLKSVREFCDEVGALMIMDEMIYGGRMALGGATERYGVIPDLATFGKAFGAGNAVAFVVGNEALATHGEIISGTYSGDTVGLRAVMETLRFYREHPVIETLWARGRQLQDGLRRLVPAELGVCEGAPVHQRIRFVNEAHGMQFAEAMWARGVLWHPGCTNIMYAHTEQQIAHVIAAADESLRCL